MSAIIAGKSCKNCKKRYSVSFGHPKWYDDVIKRGKPENATFKRFRRIAQSGLCLDCFVEMEDEEA